MISFICLIPILFFALVLAYGHICNKSIKRSQFKFMWMIIILSSFMLILNFQPKSFIDWDLIRICARVQDIKEMGLNEALKYSDVRNLYVFKWWMWISSQFSNLNIVSAVPFCIVLCIAAYFMLDCASIEDEYNLSCRRIFCQLLIWVSLFGLKLSISGIRCALAMAICSFAFYNEYILKKRKTRYVALYIIALFIHHFSLFFMMFRICVLIKKKGYLLIGAFAITQLIYPVAKLIRDHSGNDYIWMTADKLVRMWSLYGTERIFSLELSTILIFACFILIVIFGVVISFKNRKTIVHGSKAFLANEALVTLSCLGLGFCSNFLLLERTMYIFAYIMSIDFALSKMHEKNTILMIAPILLFLLYFNDINIFIVNYLGYYFL